MFFIAQLIIPLAVLFGAVWLVGFGIRKMSKKSSSRSPEKVKMNADEVSSGALFLLAGVLVGMLVLVLNLKLSNPLTYLTTLLVSSLISLGIGYYFRQLLLSVVAIIASYIWVQAQVGLWIHDAGVAPIALYVTSIIGGMVLVGLASVLRSSDTYRRFVTPLTVIGSAPALIMLFAVSTKSGLREFGQALEGKFILASSPALITLGLLIAGACGALIWSILQSPTKRTDSLISLITVGFSTLLLFLPPQKFFVESHEAYYYSQSAALSSAGVLWAFVFNIALIALLVWFIYSGFKVGNTRRVNLGVAILFILAVVKYFEWLASFMERSVFFIVTGVVFILIGWLMERGRRYLIGKIKEQANDVPLV